jgi:hypothetical protein
MFSISSFYLEVHLVIKNSSRINKWIKYRSMQTCTHTLRWIEKHITFCVYNFFFSNLKRDHWKDWSFREEAKYLHSDKLNSTNIQSFSSSSFLLCVCVCFFFLFFSFKFDCFLYVMAIWLVICIGICQLFL